MEQFFLLYKYMPILKKYSAFLHHLRHYFSLWTKFFALSVNMIFIKYLSYRKLLPNTAAVNMDFMFTAGCS